MTLPRILKRTFILFFIISGVCQSTPYYGTPLGTLQTISNNVKGEVFAVDANTIFIKGFSYDGRNEDAVFWAGSSEYPDMNGFVIPNDISKFMPIPAYLNQNIILRLPDGTDIHNIRWLSVWNRNTSKNLGSLIFSKPILPPHPMAIGPLVNTKKGVSTGDILILDTQTFLIPHFSYDGTGKETYWWLSKGTKPNDAGIILQENGRTTPLQENKNSTVIVTLPQDHFVGDYDTLSIWSKSDGEHYGFIDVPNNLNIPPSPHVLGSHEPEMEEFNCEMLNDNLGLEVRWSIKGDDAIIHLVGNIAPFEYMALGLSKDDTETRFDSADAVVAGINSKGKGFAIDYFFESNEKCNNGRGMCPDSIHGSTDNLELLQALRSDNFTVVIFKRRLRAEDKVYDQNIYTDGPQAILWAVGPLHPDGFADKPTLQSRGNLLLDFGREPNWNCPPPRKVSSPEAHPKEKTQRIHCPSDHSFRAQLGPSPRSIIKRVWFINGMPTPELVVQRGITYTFIIEGGLNAPLHHPFYITNSKEGGLYKNILEASDEVEVTYAGIQQDQVTGTIFPTAEGRLCDWLYSDKSAEYSLLDSSQEIKQTLVLNCELGKPGKLIWTPTAETPDEVYYQSFSERSLGGKIRVVDFCEETNPHHYLEINTKGSKPNLNRLSPQNHNLERETENSEIETSEPALFSPMKKENVNDEIKEHKENLNENISPETIHEIYPPQSDKYTISNNVINPFRTSSESVNERVSVADNQKLSNTTTASPLFQATESPDEVFPHDESERSDVYVPHHSNFRKTTNANKPALNSQKNNEDLALKYPTHSVSEASSISALGKQPPQEFKPQFEGGFIPLVMNPMKEKEFVQTKELVYQQEHRNRPHRPFLYNESVPFHGTFKPGVPDFSGFNISNYSQEDASVIIAHNQDNLSLLAASKPQPVHKPFPPVGTIPLHLLQHHDPLPRPQRPQDFGHRFQPQKQPSLVGLRKNVFPHLPIHNKPNFPITNIREGDLSVVSSQRVYVSMQTPEDKKTNLANIPNLPQSSAFNRKPQNHQLNKMMYPPQIQRRPDFYDEKETNLRQQNAPLRKFNGPRVPGYIKNLNQQKLTLPALQSGGLQGQVHNRPKVPNLNIPINNNNFQGNREQGMIPPGGFRNPYPKVQVPQRERIPQHTLHAKGIPMRPNPLLDERVKMNDGFLNHPQIPGKVLPFPLHMLNHKEKTLQQFQESKELDLSSSKERRTLPQLVNAELVEIPNKNMPQILNRDRPTMNPRQIMKQMNLTETQKAFVLNANIRSSDPGPSISFQKNLPLEKNSNSPMLNESIKSINISMNEENVASGMKHSDVKIDIHQTFAQNFGNDGNQDAKEKVEVKKNYDEPHKSESRPADFPPRELEKSILETSSAVEFSSSKPSKMESSLSSDYEHEEDHSDSSHSIITDADYSTYNVPFGARLKFPQNGSRIPVNTLNETPKTSFGISRRPQTRPLNNSNRNTNRFMKPAESLPSTASTTTSTTTTTTEATLLAMESISHFTFENKQNISSNEEDRFKNLYYTPPFSSLPMNSPINNSSSSSQDTGSSNEVKHIPIIADTLEGIAEPNYHGRKNILPNNSNNSFPPLMLPPKVSEDINLPQISENPPTHDNRTDYSILNHVLTLIGGP